ncbi:MAG TPA: sigma-70 family RNA polymerase sigma factor [Actinomycetota bacterium]|nr:sigma-70 family RNA polymerase sigma factor [Actinomycetota bacterium]
MNASFDREVVGRLLAEARAHGPLDPEREQALARMIGDGADASSRLEHDREIDTDDRIVLEHRARAGRDARDELVTAYLPLVVGMARRYRWAPVPMIELLQEGSLALLRAAERFDWRRGGRFGSYAMWWVRHAMSNAVNASGGVHLSASQREKLRALARARVETPGGGTSALGETTGLGDEDTAALVPLLGSPIPLDAALDERGSLAEILADRDAEEMLEEALVAADVGRVLAVADRVLGDRERLVLEARFGLGGREPETLRQVAERLGVSVQRVAQIERSALDRLRAALEVPSPS